MRLALVMALAVGVLGGLHRLYFETLILDQFNKELEWRVLSVGQAVAAESIDLILYQDFVALQRTVTQVQQTSKDFAYVFVLDPADRVLAHTFAGDFPEDLKVLNHFRGSHGHHVERIEVFGEQFRDFALPLYDGRLGVLRLGVRDREMRDRVASIRRGLTTLLIVGMLLGAAAAYGATYLGIRRFAAIGAALERFDPGRRRETIRVGGNDEASDLARKVNAVTARLHQAQTNMMRTEKMVSLGIMAAGIAHEINNPITGIQNCLRRIEAAPTDSEQTREYAAEMLRGTAHIAAVVRGLLDFARAQPATLGSVDIRDVVHKALTLTAFRIEKAGVEVSTSVLGPPDRAATLVHADEAQLTQVVVNLVLNAVDAMPGGGTLDVGVTCTEHAIVLRVSDDGTGIPPENLSRVTEPFFTTKDVGKGTGLGLAVTHGIIMQHGGDLEIHSEPEHGTEVVVQLPRINDKGPVDVAR